MPIDLSEAVSLLWEVRAHFEEKEHATRLDRDEYDLLVSLRALTRQTLTPAKEPTRT